MRSWCGLSSVVECLYFSSGVSIFRECCAYSECLAHRECPTGGFLRIKCSVYSKYWCNAAYNQHLAYSEPPAHTNYLSSKKPYFHSKYIKVFIFSIFFSTIPSNTWAFHANIEWLLWIYLRPKCLVVMILCSCLHYVLCQITLFCCCCFFIPVFFLSEKLWNCVENVTASENAHKMVIIK